MIDLIKDAFPLWLPGTILVIFLFVYQFTKLWSGKTPYKKHLLQTFVALFAYTVFCLAVTLAKQHVLEQSHLLALSLTALAAISFFTALYFERFRIVFRTAGIVLAVSAATASYANWLPQAKGGYPTPEVKLTFDDMTLQQLADEGEKIIFGGIGQSTVQGAIGRGQCPLCHTFFSEQTSERSPNLWGITARKRLHDTSIEYIAESHTCPSCYVVGGFGVKGTENRESPMPAIHKPPISLSIDELIAVDTWLFWHEGEIPPAPDEIRAVYEKLIPPDDRPRGQWEAKQTNQPVILMADGSESVEEIFRKSQCVACHIIPGIPGATGTIGPKLTMKTVGPHRIKDKNYHGKAKTTREYITESILYPNTYVVDGYRDYMMPIVFGTKLNAIAIDKMVSYLAQVEENTVPAPIR